MRVVCNSVTDFLNDVQQQIDTLGYDSILQNSIRISVNEELVNEAVTGISVHLSAVVGMGEDGQYLLEAELYCGKNYSDEEESIGTLKAEEIANRVVRFCDREGLIARSGVINI